MKVVLDTNVIVSGLNYPNIEGRTLDLVVVGDHELYVSEDILAEVARTLARKFNWRPRNITSALEFLRTVAIVIDPAALSDAVPGGHADNRILDCAVAAGADFLVTGDKRHLLPLGEHRGTRILNALELLQALEG